MALTAAQRSRLESLRSEEEGLASRLFSGAAPPTGGDLTRYDAVLSQLHELEAIEHGEALAAKMSKDRVLARIAEQQVKAGDAIQRATLDALAKLQKQLDTGDYSGIAKSIKKTADDLAKQFGTVIPASLEAVGNTAAVLDKLRAVRAFGEEMTKKAVRDFGVTFGSGMDRQLVSDIWAAKANQLSYVMQTSRAEVTEQVQSFLTAGKDARKGFAELEAAGFPDAKLSQWVQNLAAEASAAAQGGPGARAGWDAAVRNARAYVAQRVQGPGGTYGVGTRGAGKQLIANLKKAVESADQIAINRSVEQWLLRKTQYNAILSMRTATNEMYRESTNRSALNKPYVYAMQRILAAEHPKLDICNLAASADVGLGDGIYPIGMTPEEHPNGLCRDEPVIDRDFFKNGGKALAYELPEGIDKAVDKLGYRGELAGEAVRAGNEGGLEAVAGLADEHGITAEEAIEMRRADLDAVDGRNVLLADSERDLEREAASSWKDLDFGDGNAILENWENQRDTSLLFDDAYKEASAEVTARGIAQPMADIITHDEAMKKLAAQTSGIGDALRQSYMTDDERNIYRDSIKGFIGSASTPHGIGMMTAVNDLMGSDDKFYGFDRLGDLVSRENAISRFERAAGVGSFDTLRSAMQKEREINQAILGRLFGEKMQGFRGFEVSAAMAKSDPSLRAFWDLPKTEWTKVEGMAFRPLNSFATEKSADRYGETILKIDLSTSNIWSSFLTSGQLREQGEREIIAWHDADVFARKA